MDDRRDLSSPRALVLREGQRCRIAGREVVPGDWLVLAEGDRVPADAALIEANDLHLDESLLTGEPLPVAKRAGDAVSAGTVNCDGALLVSVTAAGAKTAVADIVRLVEAAQASDLPPELSPP